MSQWLVDWAGWKNASGGLGGGGEGECAPFMTGGRAVRALGRQRRREEGTEWERHMGKGPMSG